MSKKFIKRLTAPSKSDPHYYSSKNIFYACGYGMPNCTAYAWGRFYELTGKRYMTICGNAEDFYDAAKKAGLKVGSTPKLGAIVCWRAGKVKDNSDGAGHVAVVEEIKSNGDIVTSNSAWKGTEFYTKTVTKVSGYQYSSKRQFLGFIYPEEDFTTSGNSTITESVQRPSDKKTNTQIAREVISGKWGNGSDRKKRLTEAGYNYSEIQKIVNSLLSPVSSPSKKSNMEIAREVISGKWGNGSDRKKRLTEAGYNYSEIQKIVNAFLR